MAQLLGHVLAAAPDHVSAGAAGQPASRRHRRRDPRPPGRDRGRRDRVGEDHPAAEDLPGARSRSARQGRRDDRAHPAAADRGAVGGRADRRGARHRAGRPGRLPGAVHRPHLPGQPGQGDDRRHPARRAPARPAAAPLRHDHHRRGARAQPQHRLPARLPQAAAAEAPGPQADHHLRDHRRRAVRQALRRARSSRSPAAPTRSRSATARSSSSPRPTRRARRSCATRPRRSSTRCKELSAEGPGDILVFLPGEREIRDTADALAAWPGRGSRWSRSTRGSPPPSSTRSSPPHSGRRVVLATNVAETSLTVPGIRYVVDTGVARISRYSARTKVQRLPIEAISQASANQRSGRCGRVAAGIAIRLYSEEDFEARPEFTEPEILRTNLASVILQMTSLGLGDLGRFPFVEPPDRRNVTAGRQLLEELGRRLRVLDAERSAHGLTKIGRRLARLPIDPRLGRMILEAERLGCLREVLVIAAALSLQDPRERPVEHAAAGRPAARALQGRALGLPHLAQPLALPQGAAARAEQQRLPADVQAGVPQLPAGARVAGLRVAAAPGLQGDEDPRRARRADTTRRRRHPPGAALRAALPHRAARGARPRPSAGRGSTSAPAARGSRSSRAAGCTGRTRSS